MKTAQAGTVESMDCVVTVREEAPGKGLGIELQGASVARFRSVMEKTVRGKAEELGLTDATLSIQDNGALDVVLRARVETAVKRFLGGEKA